MPEFDLGFTVIDIQTLEKNAAKGLTNAQFEDGASVSFASLSEMRKQISWMRKELGVSNTTNTGFATINADMSS